MKRFAFCFLLFVLCVGTAGASDCAWDDCSVIVPEHSVNIATIKPVIADVRPHVFDGVYGSYDAGEFGDTTAFDGVPVWDDSIPSHKKNDFGDWMTDPNIETVLVEEIVPLTRDEMYAEIENLLTPMRPTSELWTGGIRNNNPSSINHRPSSSDGCPFELDAECEIWRKKPIVRESVALRSHKIRAELMDEFVAAANENNRITANADVAQPFLDRYKLLMKSARACCASGMAERLKTAGASDGLVYKYLVDDANFYNIGGRCLVMTDTDLDAQFPNSAIAPIIADVRNTCLCKSREQFAAMVAPFKDSWALAPEFANEKFNYTYTDGLQREITVSVNNDVKNVLNQLEMCP